jgi:hypothetical protein
MEEDNDDKNTNINRQQDNKGEEIKGRWVLVFCFCFVWVLFCCGSFLLCFSINQSITLGCPLGSNSNLHPTTPVSRSLPQLALMAHVVLIKPFQTAMSWALSQNV